MKNYAELGYPYSDVYKVIMCLPEITETEANAPDVNPFDKPGWKLLHIFFNIWLSGIANADPKDNPLPFIIKEDKDIFGEFGDIYKWTMQFDRFKQAWDTIPSKAINDAAKKELVDLLKSHNCFTDKTVHFDFIQGTWKNWNNNYYQRIDIESPDLSELYDEEFDGLFIAFGAFSIRLLPKGFVEPLKNGGHRIHLTEVAAYIYDGFNFSNEALLGCWDCRSKKFTGINCFKGILLSNNIFKHFREEFGKGNDFMIFSDPKIVDEFKGLTYDTAS